MKKEKSEIENDSIFIKKLSDTMKAKHESKMQEFHHAKNAAELIKEKDHELKQDKYIEHSLKEQLSKFGLKTNQQSLKEYSKEGKKAEHTHHKKGAEQFHTETVRALYKDYQTKVSADSIASQ
jgi:hypothetical protein